MARLRDSASGSDESLSQNLAAIDPLPAVPGALAAKQVLFKLFQVQYGQESGERRGWLRISGGHGRLDWQEAAMCSCSARGDEPLFAVKSCLIAHPAADLPRPPAWML